MSKHVVIILFVAFSKHCCVGRFLIHKYRLLFTLVSSVASIFSSFSPHLELIARLREFISSSLQVSIHIIPSSKFQWSLFRFWCLLHLCPSWIGFWSVLLIDNYPFNVILYRFPRHLWFFPRRVSFFRTQKEAPIGLRHCKCAAGGPRMVPTVSLNSCLFFTPLLPLPT